MENIIGNICFFHRQSDDKWLWFITDEYGRSIIKNIEPFNNIGDAVSSYDRNRVEISKRINVVDPFKQFFKE